MIYKAKEWEVEYSHGDGRNGIVEVKTEITERDTSDYGNGRYGRITVEGYKRIYDLRYERGDLHRVMLNDYFGEGLVDAKEL